MIEVAHSQRSEDLIEPAEEYLLGSGHGIRVMVGFDLVYYRKNKMATFMSVGPKGKARRMLESGVSNIR